MGKSMARCIICDNTITSENKSIEHMLLNALGGHLKSSELVCKNCNSVLGQHSDAELAKELGFAASLFDIKREKGNNQTIISEHGDYDLAPGGTPVLKKPTVQEKLTEDGKISVSIRARSLSEAKRLIKRYRKLYPQNDWDKMLKNTKPIGKSLEEEIPIPVMFDFPKICPSIIKTAVEFYLLCGGEREYIKHLLPILSKNEFFDKKVAQLFYPDVQVFHTEWNILHIIDVVGNPREKMLYAYVELFGFLCVVVVLNADYTGEEFNETYSYSFICDREMSVYKNRNITRAEIEQMADDGNYVNKLSGKIQGFMEVMNKKYLLYDIYTKAADFCEAHFKTDIYNMPTSAAEKDVAISELVAYTLKGRQIIE